MKKQADLASELRRIFSGGEGVTRAAACSSARLICRKAGRKINVSHAFACQAVGIKEVAEKIWLVTFMHYDLSFFDHQTGRVECAPNPFQAGTGVTYVFGIIRYLCNRNGQRWKWLPGPSAVEVDSDLIGEAI